MDISSLIASFSTGAYSVTRTARGATADGRVSSGTTSTFSITASVSPAVGSDLLKLPEGRRTNEVRAVITDTFMTIGGQGSAYEADQIGIDGTLWEISHVEAWLDPVSAGTGYKCLAVSAL